jgi:hypothetical protein
MSLYFKVALCHSYSDPILHQARRRSRRGDLDPEARASGEAKLRAGPRAENSWSTCAAAATLLPHSPTHTGGEHAGRQAPRSDHHRRRRRRRNPPLSLNPSPPRRHGTARRRRLLARSDAPGPGPLPGQALRLEATGPKRRRRHAHARARRHGRQALARALRGRQEHQARARPRLLLQASRIFVPVARGLIGESDLFYLISIRPSTPSRDSPFFLLSTRP